MGTLKSSLLIRSRVSCMVHSLAQRIQRKQRILYSSGACHLFARIVTEGGARGNGGFDREFFWGTVHGLPAARASPPPKRCKHHHAFLGRGRACSLALAAPLQRPYNAPTTPLHRPYNAPTAPLQRPYNAPTALDMRWGRLWLLDMRRCAPASVWTAATLVLC